MKFANTPSVRARKSQVSNRLARCLIEQLEERSLLTTPLISLATAGHTAANGAGIIINGSDSQNFSPDGRWLIFNSNATNLVSGVTDTNNAADIFLRDLQNNTTSILSVDANHNALGGGADNIAETVFSPDSKFLLFRSHSANFLPGVTDTTGAHDWFVRDLSTGVTSGITINPAGTAMGNATSFSDFAPFFTPDSKKVIFVSAASNLVDGITDQSAFDLFSRDLATQTTTLLSLTIAGNASGNVPFDTAPQLSPDGRYLAFLTTAANMVQGITDINGANDLFVKDLQTGATTLVTHSTTNTAVGFLGSSFHASS